MKVINESTEILKQDQLPEILARIFSVCKTDPSFPLKEKMEDLDDESQDISKRIEKQNKLLEETIKLRDDLSNRLQLIRQENFEIKTELLEKLGSDI